MLRRYRESCVGYTTGGSRFGRSMPGMSMSQLAAMVGIDVSYVKLIEKGKRQVVARGIVLGFAEALDLSAADADRLLFSAGLAPQCDYQARCEDYERRFAALAALLPSLPSTLTVLKERAS